MLEGNGTVSSMQLSFTALETLLRTISRGFPSAGTQSVEFWRVPVK
ncbi:hypothetical protein GPEL0_01f2493 [Geoanaerobacter pelophilus]|uniref:Uncharacterized protein n=1 Tax=Geoanaerobacter pelophilus TaxID=60036 RepID=A0ABQ0MIL3_9BACT|nr:hypothetical protein GPEL0_01f2493 [Geoanaerobacter pelophilus]